MRPYWDLDMMTSIRLAVKRSAMPPRNFGKTVVLLSPPLFRKDGGAAFPTFAGIFIRNRLLSHCRKITKTQKLLEYMDAPQTTGSQLTFTETFPDQNYHALSDADIFIFLDKAEKRCSGTTKKGIKALALKCRGHTGVEIAARYGSPPNHVTAWISKAAKMLREEKLTT